MVGVVEEEGKSGTGAGLIDADPSRVECCSKSLADQPKDSRYLVLVEGCLDLPNAKREIFL